RTVSPATATAAPFPIVQKEVVAFPGPASLHDALAAFAYQVTARAGWAATTPETIARKADTRTDPQTLPTPFHSIPPPPPPPRPPPNPSQCDSPTTRPQAQLGLPPSELAGYTTPAAEQAVPFFVSEALLVRGKSRQAGQA